MSEGLEGTDVELPKEEIIVDALEEQVESHYNLSIRDICLYLFGNREAIIKVARNSSSFWYGAFFVFFAGFAREYDQELITENPSVYFIPFLASAIMLLWVILWFQINTRSLKLLLGNSQLRSFFAVFWMTGPLAFLYAVPVEEFFTSMQAVKINLSLLALVAFWRVILFGRVIHVCTGVNFYAPLITACCVVAYPSLMLKYVSIVGVMSGSALSPEQEVLKNFTSGALGLVMISFFVSLPITLFQFFTYKKNPARLSRMPEIDQKGRVSRVFILVATILVAIGCMYFQRKLTNHSKFTSLVSASKYEEALSFVSELNPDDFVQTQPLINKYSDTEGLFLWMELKDDHPEWVKALIYEWVLINLESRWRDEEALIAIITKKKLLKRDIDFLHVNKEVFNEYVNTALMYTQTKSYDEKMKKELFEAVSDFSQYEIISEKNLDYLKDLQNK